MSVFVNRNVGNQWKKIEVTDAEIAQIEKTNFQANVRIAANVAQYLPGMISKQLKAAAKPDTPEVKLDPAVVNALIPVLVDKMTTPLHFAIENYVDYNLTHATATR